MSKDIIYREDAIEVVKKWFEVIRLNPDILIDSIISIPSADRPQGEWEIYVVSPFDGEDCRCSNCGKTGCAPYWNFCPNCGSRNVVKGADDDN